MPPADAVRANETRISALRASVRIVDATPENAGRLLATYRAAYIDDESLYRIICDQEQQPINGMTEPLNESALLELLKCPQTLALEIPARDQPYAPPRAFVLNHFTGSNPTDREAFHDFMMTRIFVERNLTYLTEDARRSTERAFESGNIVYFGECVSPESPLLTTALIVESFSRIVIQRFDSFTGSVFGKCLDSARAGAHCNRLGNQRIKRLAASLGMTRVATQDETRILQLSDSRTEFDSQASITANPGQMNAALTFGLFVGSTDELHARMGRMGVAPAE